MRAIVTDNRGREAFKVSALMRQLEAHVNQNPGDAARAYERAASRLRREAISERNSQVARDLHKMALQLDRLAEQAAITVLGSVEQGMDSIAEEQEAWGGDEGGGDVHFSSEGKSAGGHKSFPQVNGNQAVIQYGGSQFKPTKAGNFGAGGGQTTWSEAPIIRWDGSEKEAQAVTIACSPLPNTGGATYPTAQTAIGQPLNYRPYMRMWFGTPRGGPNLVDIDLGRGIQFTCITSFLTVSAGMDPPPSGYVPGSMWVTGSLGFNPSGTAANITRTRYIDAVQPSGFQNVIVPAFATSLLPILRGDTGGTSGVTLNFRDASGTTIVTFSLTGSTQQNQPLPISGDIYSIDVVNTGTATTNFHLAFTLAL